MSDVKKCKDFEYNVALWYKFTGCNYRGQYSSAMTRSNTADNCNFMDNSGCIFRLTLPFPSLAAALPASNTGAPRFSPFSLPELAPCARLNNLRIFPVYLRCKPRWIIFSSRRRIMFYWILLALAIVAEITGTLSLGQRQRWTHRLYFNAGDDCAFLYISGFCR